MRQHFAGLLCNDVSGVPVGPVRVALPDAFFVLTVGGFRTPKRARQVACGVKGSRAGSEAPGKPSRGVLQLPAVAVGITE